MVSTWIEAAAKGRHGGPVRAGQWSAVVVGTHPIEDGQDVRLEVESDGVALGPLPAYWLENKGVNSLWHVPIPPQSVGSRVRYRSVARRGEGPPVSSPHQEVVVRPNLPFRSESRPESVAAEGLVGNRHMTARVDARGSTYDVYFPTTGLHSDVRPAEGERLESRAHFRTIMGGLAVGTRLEWFDERLGWEVFQSYQGATNLLVTSLRWRHGPIRVVTTDFVAGGPDLPRTQGGTESPGQYVRRFRIVNEGTAPRRVLFGLFVQAEVNGGVGEPGLSWHDGDRALLATNRGHGHANRKLARDATVEFALALDDRGETACETAGPNEAMILRPLELPAGGSVTVDLLVSGAFTGWRGDLGTFEHWLKPALAWFRAADVDRLQEQAAAAWDAFVDPLPALNYPGPAYGVSLRRSALAAALHADAKWGAIVSGYDQGLRAYCWPRDAIFAGLALERAGHRGPARGVFEWVSRIRSQSRPYAYWFQKYTTDGWPEWETPAVDQSAMIPWAVERHARRTGDLDFVRCLWPAIEQAAAVCFGESGHPGLRWLEDLALITSASLWDNRFGAFLYSNAAVVAGLRAAARLGRLIDRAEGADAWEERADRIWYVGILGDGGPDGRGPGLVDREAGRFLDARRVSSLRSLWTDRPEALIDRSAALDISALGPCTPFGLIPSDDPRLLRTAEELLRRNAVAGDPDALTCWSSDPARPEARLSPGESHQHDPSSLATLWMARHLIRLGRETGDGRHWARAVELIRDILGRLGPLGLSLQVGRRRGLDADPPRAAPGVWSLHATLIDALMDLGGVEYDAIDRRIALQPSLPPGWPSIGQDLSLPPGRFGFTLERAGTDGYALTVASDLDAPADLRVGLTLPGLSRLTRWEDEAAGPRPTLEPALGHLAFAARLPAGAHRRRWAWAGAPT